MFDSYDHEIREALHKKKLRKYHQSTSETLVLDELGLLHGSNRIDVAVINGNIHGYEIKSSKDTLKRLNGQLKAYTAVLQKLTFVVAPNHFEELMDNIPCWSGVIIANKGSKGAITFKTLRHPKINPEFDPFSVSHLLWKNEAQSILKAKGLSTKDVNLNRKELYALICKHLETNEIVSSIKEAFIARADWRADELQMKYGD
ncbi:sce7726 family protein [Shewanella electrodiphila]|uniref:Sce7726 family protein n=1 Tax=Shewanella electrodiphila TaxID=934143 RepID=A0ABT0KT22_9GAMM|nr:sce7726 family protein [Shewanella electrodiphila]MCL1047011.1 sce7726 family protein [Shewanella electrodiphila]